MDLSLFGKEGWIVKGEQDSSLWLDARIKKDNSRRFVTGVVLFLLL